jgi:hypothetical protein
MELTEIIKVLQIAVSPVILISGVGMLLLSITNRYGRVIDRSRVLGDEARKSGHACGHVWEQVGILLKRARLLRASIICGVTAVLCAAVLVIGLFLGSVLGIAPAVFVVILFSACMLLLIASLVLFLRDINLSLAALDLDVANVKSVKKID